MKYTEPYNNAVSLLHKAVTQKGFVASISNHDNYQRVWARDGSITVIAALLTHDAALHTAAANTIETLFNNQHALGFMPSNVTVTDNTVSYGGIVGRADNGSWCIIGLGAYTLFTNDNTLAKKYKTHVYKILDVMNVWEFNAKNLMYMPQSGDWADEYIHEGYTLGIQLLRLWALRLAAYMYGDDSLTLKVSHIVTTIVRNYWKQSEEPSYFCPSLQRFFNGNSSYYWLLGFNPARVFQYFDLQANALALLLLPEYNNIPTLYYIKELIVIGYGKMLPAFYPTIQETDADFELLRNNYAYAFKNYPNAFHNGGLWAVWNGFMASALYKHNEGVLADELRKRIHDANSKNNNEFNECLHGIDNQPGGVPFCTWSAAGAIIAEQHKQFKKLFSM
jgi:hypothetical protein